MFPGSSTLINQCFRGLLGRDALPHELEHYQQGGEHAGIERLCQTLVMSDEFKNRGVEGREFVPPGHFYSVIPSFGDRDNHLTKAQELERQRRLPGIEVDEAAWKLHLERIAVISQTVPFPVTKTEGFRYYFDNPFYSYGDAISLYRMLVDHKPARIVEVGSGFSSAIMLDTMDRVEGYKAEITFVEPCPDILRSLLSNSDFERTKVIVSRVQDVPMAVFTDLKAGDILFIDSTHVSKLGIDVNHLYFEVLPRLARGVRIHVHDIFWPFEYPAKWISSGRAWNEAYLLRAILSDTQRYGITYFSDYMRLFHNNWIQANAPLIAKKYGGHIWLEVTG